MDAGLEGRAVDDVTEKVGRWRRLRARIAGLLARLRPPPGGDRQAVLLEISRAMLENDAKDLGALAEFVFARAAPLLGADISLAYVADPAAGTLSLVGAPGLPGDEVGPFRRLDGSEGYCAHVAATATPLVADARRIARDAPLDRVVAHGQAMGLRAYACHPLLGRGGQVLGTLGFGSARRDRFRGDDLHFLGTLAHLVALGWQRHLADAALRNSEARFRAAVEAVSAIVWTNDAEGRMTGDQPGWSALTGQDRAAYEGFGWVAAVHPEDAAPSLAAWQQAVAARQPFVSEHRVRRHDGAWRHFAIRAIPVQHADGSIAEWVGVHTDITGQREAEAVLARDKAGLEHLVAQRTAALRDSEARLAQAAKLEALGRLAGGVAHDFNNVLQAVQGGLSLAARRVAEAPAEARRFLDLAADAAERGAAVTRRLLAFARRGELETVAVEALLLLDGLAQLLRHTLGPGVVLAVESEGAVPALMADPGQLEAVLVNLANNARDALPEGRGRIALSAARARDPVHLPPGDYVRLAVADDGAGMTEEVLARVTEPFFTTKPKGQGTGLGLAMARGFAEQSGGRLGIESRVGQGTTVSIWLPAAGLDEATRPPARDGAAPQPGEATAAILLVDDEAGVRAVLAAALLDRGHAVVEAEDAAAALARLEQGLEVDVLVTDLAMPGALDGLDLVREARRLCPRLPALLVTGHVGHAARAALDGAAGSGPFAVLRKPVPAEAVGAQVAALLRGRAARPRVPASS